MITNTVILTILMQVSTIDGQVRDSRNHSPIAFARIELLSTQHLTDVRYTDDDGNFHFSDVESGPYTLSITHPGYEPTAVDGRAKTGNRLSIDLSPAIQWSSNQPAVVSAREYLIPESARKLFGRARKEMQKQDCANAILHFESGLRIFDRDATAQNGLGNCYGQFGQWPEAERSFRRAVSLDNSPYIALNLADVCATQKRYAEAESVLTEAIRKTPQSGDAYYGLAILYFRQERFDEAEKTALEADRHTHRIPDLHLLLAKLYERRRDEGMILDQLKLYLREAPNGAASKRIREALKK